MRDCDLSADFHELHQTMKIVQHNKGEVSGGGGGGGREGTRERSVNGLHLVERGSPHH